MTSYLFPEYAAGDELDADDLTLDANKIIAGTYTPVITASGGTVSAGASGFIRGWYYRQGLWINWGWDINLEGSGVSIAGTTWRITLPFTADLSFHDADVLDDASHRIGGYQTRSATAAESLVGSVLLCGPSATPTDGTCGILYKDASNTSVGSGDFTTEARIKANGGYLADASQFP